MERHGSTGLDTLTGCPVRSMLETTGPPRFLADPDARMPRSLTPVRPRRLALPRRSGAAFPIRYEVGPQEGDLLSELHDAACVLPVYASQPGLPPHHATLGSGWSLAFAGRAHPAGSD